ncbi:MAG: glutathione S-transferase family protein [Pseudomonadota bacterium]
MKLHVFPPSPNARKCLVTTDLASVQLEQIMVDLQAGDQKKPTFLALNPNGKMPVLEYEDGTTLWESNAIVNRLAAEGESDLWPKTNARYDILQWQFWEMAHWAPATTKFLGAHFFQAPIDKDAATAEVRGLADVLDGQLNGRDWLVGDAITTADISVASTLCYRDICGIPVDGYSNIAGWLDRIESIPAWQKANPAMEVA